MKYVHLILFSLFICFTACKKDLEEVEQTNEEELFCKKWQVINYDINGEAYTFNGKQFWEFKLDHELVITFEYPNENSSVSVWNWEWLVKLKSFQIQDSFQYQKNIISNPFFLANLRHSKNEIIFELLELNSTKLIIESNNDENTHTIEFKPYIDF